VTALAGELEAAVADTLVEAEGHAGGHGTQPGDGGEDDQVGD